MFSIGHIGVCLYVHVHVGAVVFNNGAFNTSVPVKPLMKGDHHLPAVQLLRRHAGTIIIIIIIIIIIRFI